MQPVTTPMHPTTTITTQVKTEHVQLFSYKQADNTTLFAIRNGGHELDKVSNPDHAPGIF